MLDMNWSGSFLDGCGANLVSALLCITLQIICNLYTYNIANIGHRPFNTRPLGLLCPSESLDIFTTTS
jgi:hypothetical protein